MGQRGIGKERDLSFTDAPSKWPQWLRLAGPSQNQEPGAFSGSFYWVQGSKDLSHLPLASQAHSGDAGAIKQP